MRPPILPNVYAPPTEASKQTHLEQRAQPQPVVVDGGHAAAAGLDGGARGGADGADLEVERAVDGLGALWGEKEEGGWTDGRCG
jgi:hypothetical protein